MTDAIVSEICERLAEGESLVKICRDQHMPSRRTVVKWQEDNAEFRAECARAREMNAEREFEDMADIERDVLAGKVDPQAAKVAISSKQWRLPKLASKYKDVQRIEGDMTLSLVSIVENLATDRPPKLIDHDEE